MSPGTTQGPTHLLVGSKVNLSEVFVVGHARADKEQMEFCLGIKGCPHTAEDVKETRQMGLQDIVVFCSDRRPKVPEEPAAAAALFRTLTAGSINQFREGHLYRATLVS